MPTAGTEAADRALLSAIQTFVAESPDPKIARFKDAIANWGETWEAVAPVPLPAAETLGPALDHTSPATHALARAFHRHRATRKWEQSYTRADGVVGEDMLAGYGFAEVIGKAGPFLSTRVRSGIGVWGPGIDYPPHRHGAEEIYVPLAGEAVFRLGEGAAETRCGPGTSVYVPSMLTHGFRTEQRPFAVFYIWQAGDLREKSRFGPATDRGARAVRRPR